MSSPTKSGLFDAAEWIRKNHYEAETLEPETFHVVANFTLMWNLFEATLCDNEASVPTLTRLASQEVRDPSALEDISEAIAFWRKRYVEADGSFGYLYTDLWGERANPRREEVEAILLGRKDEVKDHLLAVMIIIYRLRNNLFHGRKAIAELKHQVNNLDVACRTLAALMKALGAEGVKR